VGYVLNDCAVSFTHDIQKLYKSYASFLRCKLPPLEFPLMKLSKFEIYDAIPREISQLCVYCENPVLMITGQYEPCHHCTPCVRKDEIDGNRVYQNKLINNEPNCVLKDVESALPVKMATTWN